MKMTVEEIVAAVQELTEEEQEQFLIRLSDQIAGTHDPGNEHLWAKEANHRLQEYRGGRVKSISGKKVIAEARKIVDDKLRVPAAGE